MRRKTKRHDHLKKLYREELANRATAGVSAKASDQSVTNTGNRSTLAVNHVAAASVMTAAEQRWLRRDLFRTIMVVLILVAIIALIAVYQDQSSIVNFTTKVAHWGGF